MPRDNGVVNERQRTQHTPGPWTLETVKTQVGVCHKVGPLGSSTKIHSACLYDDCYSDEPRDLQLLADARLIAAAPELLEACKALLPEGWDDGVMDHMPGIKLARLTIAKAEGR